MEAATNEIEIFSLFLMNGRDILSVKNVFRNFMMTDALEIFDHYLTNVQLRLDITTVKNSLSVKAILIPSKLR